MSKLAILGGNGNVGRRLVVEALARGHQVTVVARTVPEAGIVPDSAAFLQGDVATAPEELGQNLAGHDALICAVRFSKVSIDQVMLAAKTAGISRLLVVGGSGSLETEPGIRIVDTPSFPDAFKGEAVPGAAVLDRLLSVDDIDWTVLCPAKEFPAGARTGTFRLGGDTLLKDASGLSSISMEDYAVAMLDELENPAHIRKRFSVAY